MSRAELWFLLSPAGGRKVKEGRTSDLRGVNVAVTAYVNGEPRTQLELLEGFQKIPFGTGALSCHIAVRIIYPWNRCRRLSVKPYGAATEIASGALRVLSRAHQDTMIVTGGALLHAEPVY